MKLSDEDAAWGSVLARFALVVGALVTIVLSGFVLAVIGSAIALMAVGLGGWLSDLMNNLAREINSGSETTVSFGTLNHNLVPVIAVLGCMLLTGFALRWFDLSKAIRTKLDKAVEAGTEWVVKLAELILLATVFMLAAKKLPTWPIQLLSLAVLGCLAFHVIRPIAANLTGPAMSSIGKKQSAAAIFIVLLLIIIALDLTSATLVFINIGLQGLLESGIAN